MCKSDGKTVNHLLLHCLVARELWLLVLSLFGVAWVVPDMLVGLFACWKGRFCT